MAKPSSRRLNKLSPPLSQEELDRIAAERKIFLDKMAQQIEDDRKKEQRRDELLDFLDIPHYKNSSVLDTDAVLDFLMDENKFKILATKLRNKMFW